jgi:hypothetical protein
MRQNGGGDFFVGRKDLIKPLKERPAINQKGKLFVLIGRQTFSAARVNAIDFRKDTNAILVGEPIGERPNSYSRILTAAPRLTASLSRRGAERLGCPFLLGALVSARLGQHQVGNYDVEVAQRPVVAFGV